MARLPATQGTGEISERILERRGGKLRPLDEMLLHSPQIADGWNSLLGAIRSRCTLADDVRELIIMRIAVVNRADYEWGAHVEVAAETGIEPAQLAAIRLPEVTNDPTLSPRQQRVIAYTDAMTNDIHVSDDVFDALRADFTEHRVGRDHRDHRRVQHGLPVPRGPAGRTARRRRGWGMTGRLAGKVAIISGAGSVGPGWGNGRATAIFFAREGAKVFLVDREDQALQVTAEQVRTDGGTAATRIADVTDEASVAAMVEACVAEFGTVDVLVNNVGGSRAGRSGRTQPCRLAFPA